MKAEWLTELMRIMLVAVLIAIAPVASFAQPDQSQLWTMTTVEVHHHMIQEFEELQKELSAAYKKAGMTQRLVSQVVRGPAAEYVFLTPVEKWADYDETGFMAKAMGEAGAARWLARVTKCVKSRRVDTIESRPDLSIPLKDGRTPKLAVWTTRNNLPGRYPEYNDFLVKEWVPAMKEAGMDGVFYNRNAFGGSSRQWTTFSLVDDWAAFDQEHPVRRTVGEEKWGELMIKSGPLTTAATRKILRLRPDLGINTSSPSS